MVIISRTRTKIAFWASIRGKILLAFFVIVGVSFAVAALNLTGLVRNYLLEQRAREDRVMTEKLASEAASAFQNVHAEEISRKMFEQAGQIQH